MTTPRLSAHFASRQPSDIRAAQIEFARRTDTVKALNVAIGNVSLPMHPALQKRMGSLATAPESPFKTGVVKYSETVGMAETRQAFLNILAGSGYPADGLLCQVTDGGSQAMELIILGLCGPAGSEIDPLLLIDPAYTNYKAMANRTGRKVISISRFLDDEGRFALPDMNEIEALIQRDTPNAMVVIPYDNPTGSYFTQDMMLNLAALCVKYNLWMISDEAYRELLYTDDQPVSIWSITNARVPGIEGRRISIETASKVWNACGLRIGAIITDNVEFHEKSVAENTANLCSNTIGQYIFGSLAHETPEALQDWYQKQRDYYFDMMGFLHHELTCLMPGLIVSRPDASLYSVLDVKHLVGPAFNVMDFVMYCARQGKVNLEGTDYTLLVAPMSGFYSVAPGQENPGRTKMRISFVETPANMKRIPALFKTLFEQYRAL